MRITSIETTCRNVTIQWVSPLDENGNPYTVRIEYSFRQQRETTDGSVLAPPTLTKWTIEDIPSEVSLKITLAAINKRSKAGRTVQTTVKTPC